MITPPFMPRRAVALLAAAGALAACDAEQTPQFAPESGQLTGLVFLDVDNDGRFSPASGDSLRPGAIVRVVERGSRTGASLAIDTADAQGRIAVNVKAGTHDLLVDSASVAPRFFCGGQRAAVRAAESAFAGVVIRGGCVIRIDTAKTRPVTTTVTVAGIVTAAPGRFRSQGDNLYLQNATGNQGGVQVFGAAVGGLNLQEGDSIEVTGNIGLFNQEIQLTSPRVGANIQRAVRAVPPLVLRTGQADSSRGPILANNGIGNANMGRLLQYRRARIVSVATTGTPTPTGANIEVTDGSSPVNAQVRLAGTSFTAIGPTRFTVGRCYDITGVLSVFSLRPQLLPRTTADVTEVPCP
jgi:hypothetical protein